MADLIAACMAPQPELRPSAEDIIIRLSALLPPAGAGREALPARAGSGSEPGPTPLQDSAGRSSDGPASSSSGPAALHRPLLGGRPAGSSGILAPDGWAAPSARAAPAALSSGGSYPMTPAAPDGSRTGVALVPHASGAGSAPAPAVQPSAVGLTSVAESCSKAAALVPPAPQAPPAPFQVPRSPSDMMPPSPFS